MAHVRFEQSESGRKAQKDFRTKMQLLSLFKTKPVVKAYRGYNVSITINKGDIKKNEIKSSNPFTTDV